MTGHIREFKISPKDSVPHGITKGVNGEIWFSQFLAKKISKLDFKQGGSKSRVDFFLGKKGGTPHDLLVDSKRDIIWYLDNHGDQIGKIPKGFYPGKYLKDVGGLLAKEDGKKWIKSPEKHKIYPKNS